MAITALTATQIQASLTWTGTAPGGTATPAGTLASATSLATWVTAVELDLAADTPDVTTFLNGGWKSNTIGLKSATMKLTIDNDYASSQFDSLVWGWFGGAILYLDIQPLTGARGVSNPSYVLGALVTQHNPISVSVGGVSQTSLSWTVTGALGRLTA